MEILLVQSIKAPDDASRQSTATPFARAGFAGLGVKSRPNYTARDPVAALEIIGPYVTGVVAKDCAGPHFMEREVGAPPVGTPNPDPRGDEVMIQFGTGKVNFAGIFTRLKSLGFNGPIMVEGTAVGATLQETIANARANRAFLEKIA